MANTKSPSSSPMRDSQRMPDRNQSTSPVRDTPSTRPNKPPPQQGVDVALAEPFPQFGHQDIIVKPFDDELRRDMEFQEQLHQLLLKLFIDFHAWSTSRPDSESTAAGNALLEETQAILSTEREQETSRVRLLEFIKRIKDALAVLTGL